MVILYENESLQKLIQLRHQKGMSVHDISLSIGQNLRYINNIESGKFYLRYCIQCDIIIM